MGAQPGPPGKCGVPGPGGVICSRLPGHWAPDDPYRYHEGGGYRWSDSGTPLPKEPTTSPPSPDVDALLAEARTWCGHGVTARGALDIIPDLVRAVLAERGRAERVWQDFHKAIAQRDGARAHLRVVLAHGWPEGTTGPACVLAARAFLEGRAERAAPAASDVAPVRDDCPKDERALWWALVKATDGRGLGIGDAKTAATLIRPLVLGWLEGGREETRKALAAQNQAETRVAELEEAVRRLAAMVPAKGEA